MTATCAVESDSPQSPLVEIGKSPCCYATFIHDIISDPVNVIWGFYINMLQLKTNVSGCSRKSVLLEYHVLLKEYINDNILPTGNNSFVKL